MNGNWGPGVSRLVQKEVAKTGAPLIVAQRKLVQRGKLVKRNGRVELAPTAGTSKLREMAESKPKGRYVR